jgi:hypothetical protein
MLVFMFLTKLRSVMGKSSGGAAASGKRTSKGRRGQKDSESVDNFGNLGEMLATFPSQALTGTARQSNKRKAPKTEDFMIAVLGEETALQALGHQDTDKTLVGVFNIPVTQCQ